MVKTGARAAVLASMLSTAGHQQSDVKMPAPRLHDLTDDLAQRIREQLESLGGDPDAAPQLRPGSWDLALEGGLLVELDEELHFNRYRAQTLRAPWARDLPWISAYIEYCVAEEQACLAAARWGKRWTNPSCERFFGAAAQPGDFENGGAPRWKQRALYDTIKDAFAVSQPDYRLARVSVHDQVDGVPLEAILRTPNSDHFEAVAALVTSRAH